MPGQSFYDLDFIIEVNEQRLEQYAKAYQKILERLTNILLIYSAITFFLVPIVQEAFLAAGGHRIFIVCFAAFSLLFLTSLAFTIRLIIPVEVAYLEMPRKYYFDYLHLYEELFQDKKRIDALLKASYIDELEIALDANMRIIRRKRSFYYSALIFALLSAVPYTVCLGFHLAGVR